MKSLSFRSPLVFLFLSLNLFACREKNTDNARQVSYEMDLKRGELITCGPPKEEFGFVSFETSCR